METLQCFEARFQIHLLPSRGFERLGGGGAYAATALDIANRLFGAE